MKQKSKIIKLNIVMSYPVKWTKYDVMENYIQNFYDSVDMDSFLNSFHYSYKDNTLKMKSNVCFGVDLLKYLGASTKRNNDTSAGSFGEGFKIAALVSVRDFHYDIFMESGDWRIHVTEQAGEIDKTKTSFLAYEFNKKHYKKKSVLTIKNISQNDYEVFLTCLNHFYYPQNPALGIPIYVDRTCAIYHSGLTGSENKSLHKGRLFLSCQQRDVFCAPIVLCNHTYKVKDGDRDRYSISYKDFNKSILEIIDRIDDHARFEFLECLISYWKNHYEKRVDWSEILYSLIKKLSFSEESRKKFSEKYSSKFITDISYSNLDPFKAKICKNWFLMSKYHNTHRIISRWFESLGIESLYQLCERNDVFIIEVYPNEIQRAKIQILEDVANEFFSDLLCYTTYPTCKLIKNYGTPYAGLAIPAEHAGIKTVNSVGIRVKYKMKEIQIHEYVINSTSFEDALAIYLHELFHHFGGDKSKDFTLMLIYMNKRLMEIGCDVKKYKEKWESII